MPGLTIRKVADHSVPRVTRFDPVTGEKYLAHPDTPHIPQARPLTGIRLDVAPGATVVSTSVVSQGIAEGWLTAVGEKVVHRPGGSSADKWAVTHTFRQATALVFHTLDGDVTYKVTHNPDKYADYEAATYPDQVKRFKADDATPVTDEHYDAGATRVDWFYTIVKEG